MNEGDQVTRKRAFTLTELLVVTAIIALLAALLLPAMSATKARAKRVSCLDNLRQINVALRLYSDDGSDTLPNTPGTDDPILCLTGYKKLLKSYLRPKIPDLRQRDVFSCPADTFHFDDPMGDRRFVPRGLWEEPISDHSSYGFNGGNSMGGGRLPGIAGRRLSSIRDMAKTILVTENSAFIPWSWHEPRRPLTPQNAVFNDAKNVASFADGHAAYIRIYWAAQNPAGPLAMCYDPPARYDYKWSGD
jgi:prepilin-type N-terminal cleavage/methylation domain-containing protein